jgi:hypothetical protein
MQDGRGRAPGADEIVNAWEARFSALLQPRMRDEYNKAAASVGMQFGPETELTPMIVTESTLPVTTTQTHAGIPVSLNVDQPTATMRFRFQDGAFIRRVTSTVTAIRLEGDGQPEPGFFEGFVDPRDYIYVQFQRDGAGQIFQTRFMPLSELSGPGSHAYFFNLIPAVQPTGSILVNVSINPPTGNLLNPFVERVGMVTISMHSERFNAFGI